MIRCPVPPAASYRDLLRDLLGRTVDVRATATPQQLRPEATAYLAGYRFDDGAVAAVAVTDLPLSAAAAGAIAALPPTETRRHALEAGALDDEPLEFLHEVVNVAAKLLNSPTTPHVVLSDLLPVPGEVPDDLGVVAAQPRVRRDWHVEVEGYGDGTLTLLQA